MIEPVRWTAVLAHYRGRPQGWRPSRYATAAVSSASPSPMSEPFPRVEAAFVEVAVNSGQPARHAFTYARPEGIDMHLGQAVFAPFGSRILQGVVLGETDSPPEQQARAIEAVADPLPVLDGPHRALALWLSEQYFAPLWECVATCLPAGYGQRSVTAVSPVDVPLLLPADPADQHLLRYLTEHGRTTLETLREAFGAVPAERLERLQASGHLTVAQGLARPAGRPRTERRVALAAADEAAREHARALAARTRRSVAARVLGRLAEAHDIALAEARALGAERRHLDELAEGGWLREYEARVERDPLGERPSQPLPPAMLTETQAAAVEAVAAAPGAYLLHGVTGSGKTEVYLELARRTLAAGGGVIVLVPEISLTPQAIRRYGEQFPADLTVLHSSLSMGELYDQWYRIQRGEGRLVVGSRSAVFAPVPNLGLVVLDEEHEWTYKQAEPQPRYHARDAAAELCRLTSASLVLGSATPDVTTYHRAEVGELTRLELPSRVTPLAGGATQTTPLPNVSVVDMREELKAGNRGIFSVPLAGALRRALTEGEQSILFVNRRGAARFLLCRACGYLPSCPSCTLAMGLDTREPLHPRVFCHHCGRSRSQETACPECGSPRYRPFGVGTQRIEDEARRAFPEARVARWDSDAASRKGSHERILQALEAREIDILVGTQMLAKGLDLPAMTVVGVVDADVGLSLPDYVAHERTFQLLSQVAGRAGRRERPGEVFIQTYEPDAPPIRATADHDYRSFFAHETQHRRRAGYPPYSRLARLTYRHTNQERGLAHASQVAAELRTRRDAAGWPDPDVLGPAPAYVRRLRGDYRWHILLRGHDPRALIEQITLGRRWSVDIDPVSLL